MPCRATRWARCNASSLVEPLAWREPPSSEPDRPHLGVRLRRPPPGSSSDRFAIVRVAFGTDEETAVTKAVQDQLHQLGHEVVVMASGAEWPEVGHAVGQAVVDGTADRGVVCCTTGTGVSMAANKVSGARAALCADAETAKGARRWNDANVLAFGLRLTTETMAEEMLQAFLTTPADPEEKAAIARVEENATSG